MMNQTRSTERLAELIQQKRDLLHDLRQLVARQYQLVKSQELAPLIRLLATKQSVLERLHQLEAQLEPFRDEDPDARIWSTPEARAACRVIAEECPQLLSDIKKIEAASEQLVRAQRDEVAEQVDRQTSRNQAVSRYLQQDVSAVPTSRWSLEEPD